MRHPLTRRAWLALLAGCAEQGGAPATVPAGHAAGPVGPVLFSLDFVAGQRTGLPNRTQVTLGEPGQGGPILRTLAGPGRLSGSDAAVADVSLCRVFALNLPARPLALGRVFAEPTDSILMRNIYLLAPLVFTPRPGRALYLGNIAILQHSWAPTREPHITPSSHRALRDLGARDLALLRAREPALAGLKIGTLPRPPGWSPDLPPRSAWPDGNAPRRDATGPTSPPWFGPPGQPLAPPGTPVRALGQPSPPPGFGPPGVAPSRFGRGTAQ